MHLTREQELKIFRNVNGVNRIWEPANERVSLVDSNQILHLRQNQAKTKSKLMRHVIKNDLPLSYWTEEKK